MLSITCAVLADFEARSSVHKGARTTELTPLKGAMAEKKLQELKAEREPLFRRFATHPNEVRLAIQIKFIDDQIAECNHDIQLKRKNDPAFRGKVRLSRQTEENHDESS